MATPSAPPFEEEDIILPSQDPTFQPLLTQPSPMPAPPPAPQPSWTSPALTNNNYSAPGVLTPPVYTPMDEATRLAAQGPPMGPVGSSSQRPPSLPPPVYQSPHGSFRDPRPPGYVQAVHTTNVQLVQQQAPATHVIFTAPAPAPIFHSPPIGSVTPPPVAAVGTLWILSL